MTTDNEGKTQGAARAAVASKATTAPSPVSDTLPARFAKRRAEAIHPHDPLTDAERTEILAALAAPQLAHLAGHRPNRGLLRRIRDERHIIESA